MGGVFLVAAASVSACFLPCTSHDTSDLCIIEERVCFCRRSSLAAGGRDMFVFVGVISYPPLHLYQIHHDVEPRCMHGVALSYRWSLFGWNIL